MVRLYVGQTEAPEHCSEFMCGNLSRSKLLRGDALHGSGRGSLSSRKSIFADEVAVARIISSMWKYYDSMS
jgi:hypothetical protein